MLALALLVLLGLGGNNWYRYLRAGHYYRAAQKAAQQRDFAQARALARTSLDAGPNSPRVHFLLARIARQAGSYESAEDHLDACQRLEGLTERVQLERALVLVQQGALTLAAEGRLRGYLKDNHPDSEQILEALSRGCLATYRLNSALGYLDEWLDRHPDNAQAHLWRGTTHERLMNFEDAKNDFRQAAERAPQITEVQLRLAEGLLKGGESKEAAERFEDLHRAQPKNPVFALGLAQALIRLGLFDQAEKLLAELLEKYPDDPPVILERGRLALQKGEPAAAEPWLRKAAALAPADYQSHYSLFLCLKQKGDAAAARAVEAELNRLHDDIMHFEKLNEQLKQHPYDLDVRCEVARVFLRQGQKEEAVRWLKMVLRMDSAHQVANRLLADYYEENGQPGVAAPYREHAGAKDSPVSGATTPPAPPGS